MRPLVPVENVQQLPLDRATLGDAMKRAGYATALFGKWHLGQQGKYHPSARGFDEAITSMGKHFDFVTQPKVDYPKGAYLADWLTDKSLAFIDKNKDRPFFLCLHHFGVHAPHEAKPELIERFKNKPGAGGHNNATYAAMIYSVDESVGRVLAHLDELKLSGNTLVIFTTDNGGVGGYVEAGVKTKEGITNNAPLRGGKGMLYEGGIRVPWIARWPGKVKAGLTCEEPIIGVDLYPTLLACRGEAEGRSGPRRDEHHSPALRQWRAGPGAGADAALLALPRLPGRGQGRLAHHTRGGDPRRGLEAGRVLRDGEDRALQPGR